MYMAPTPPAPADDPATTGSPCTCFQLRKLSRLLSQRYDAALAPAGLNVNQYSILRRADRAPHSVGSLAAELGMDRSTLSRDLKHLVDAGWLRSVACEDARRRRLVVTASGKRRIARAHPLWRTVQAEVEALVGGHGALANLHAQIDAATARVVAPG
ncbi:MarR family winged helix-turn-helix transcriptional regulator [Luteimonas saliphila]|uniref:MarR family winged helix-turn-helix transcriptional regulator n=1 Tax=Luteimonas saliphila TaxID=2804919 RepID=UPI001EE25D77|nr:MarR family winged helix-turn-helix transcriptional regulator [Luteimonas saliphila]